MDNRITPEMARAELARRRSSSQVTPEMARSELERRRSQGSSLGHKIGAFTDGVAQALTGNFSDEMEAGIKSGTLGIKIGNMEATPFENLWGNYDEELSKVQSRMDENQKVSPGYRLGGELAGGLTGGAGMVKNGLTMVGRTGAKSLGGKVATGMGEGAAYGALYGAGGAKEGERGQGAKSGAVVGALTGGLIEGGAGVLAKKRAIKSMPKVQTSDEIKDIGRGLYQKTKKSGLIVKKDAFKDAATDIVDQLSDFGYDPDLQKGVGVLEKRFAKALDQDLSLPELDNLRKLATNVARDGSDSEQAAASIFIDAVDDLVLSEKNWVGSNKEALQDLTKARKVWKQAMKASMVEEAMYRASNAASGLEQGTRNAFRAILNNPKKRKAFSKQETLILEMIANGSKKQNLAKLIGKLGFGSHGANSFLGGTIGVGVGGLAGGPVGAMVAPLAGYGASRAATNIGQKGVNQLQRTMQNGGVAPQLAIPTAKPNPLLPGVIAPTVGLLQ